MSQAPGHGYSRRHLDNFEQVSTEWSFLPWERQGVFKELQEKQHLAETYKITKFHQRTLLDAFSGSLLHVNRIYNRAFGYKSRKVPSHMPHMVDVDIMNELQAKFPEEFDKTSSHKLRSPNDMQFALSYFYYVIDQTKEFNFSHVFEEVDVDKSGKVTLIKFPDFEVKKIRWKKKTAHAQFLLHNLKDIQAFSISRLHCKKKTQTISNSLCFTGTLSDRELRILLAKFSKLPLDTKTIKAFTDTLKNCSSGTAGQQPRTRPKAERQHGYELPLITESLLRACASIVKQLNDSKKAENKFKHEIVGEDDIAFKMIKNNATHVLLQLDEMRKNRKKFICLNDNIEHKKGNSTLVKSLLVDFYESLFPLPSQFELPNNLRNRFLYVDQLKAWKNEKRRLEFFSDGIFVGGVVAVLTWLFGHHVFYFIRRVVVVLFRKFQTPKSSSFSSTKLLTV